MASGHLETEYIKEISPERVGGKAGASGRNRSRLVEYRKNKEKRLTLKPRQSSAEKQEELGEQILAGLMKAPDIILATPSNLLKVVSSP